MPLINGISFNEKVFYVMSIDEFKDLYEAAGYKSTGLTSDQLAEKLGIIKPIKAEKKPAE